MVFRGEIFKACFDAELDFPSRRGSFSLFLCNSHLRVAATYIQFYNKGYSYVTVGTKIENKNENKIENENRIRIE